MTSILPPLPPTATPPTQIDQIEENAKILYSLTRAICCVGQKDGEVLLELARQVSEGLTELIANAREDGL